MKTMLALALVALSLAPMSARAQWVYLSSNDTLGMDLYADLNSVRKAGNVRTVLELWNFAQTGRDGELSTIVWSEIDCNHRSKRMLAFIDYDQAIGHGKALNFQEIDAEWRAIRPNSVGNKQMKTICEQ